MTFAFVKQDDLQWTRGAPSVFKSSNMAQRGFCKDCGTPLAYKFHADEIAVMTCTLDDPTAAPPTEQYGVESVVPWCGSSSHTDVARNSSDARAA